MDFIHYYDHGKVGSLLLFVIAMVLEACFSNFQFIFRYFQHPIVTIGKFISFLDNKLNRLKRSERDRAIRGFISVVIVTSAAISFGYVIMWLSANHPFGWIVELLLLVIFLAGRELYNAVNDVRNALDIGNIEKSRSAVSEIVGRDTALLDQYGIGRAAIESLAENFADAVIAPTFWYILFGFPGLLVSKAINTMDSMIGYKTEKYKAFGMSAARLDDILNLIPARLAGGIIVLAAIFVPKANPIKAFFAMLRDSSKHRSLNAGWPEAAMAGALDIALAGPRRYSSGRIEDSWMGNGSARVTTLDIAKALYVYLIACLINLGLILLLIILMTNLP